MSFFHKLEEAILDAPETFRKGLEHAEATVEGLLEPNRRHDNPAEIRADHIRARINSSHRFVSFANIRANNFVKWHIDGNDFFYAVSELLDSAREVIMILDWWLTPELYLRRPPAYHENWRLDRLLLRKARQGVKIYIVVYKEVTQTMNMSSHHTKAYLESLHENIAVMRHPDHIGSKDDVEFWSHHEKVVIVDNHRASIGGLDLCFGRWDTHNHPLADLHPTDFARTLFPGQDYNNARVLDFQHVDNYVSNQISIQDTTRMPWHDVHMTIVGPSVLDVVQHFVERWNEIKTRKYENDNRFDWLAFPHNISAAPNEAIIHHPYRDKFHQMGKHFRQRFHCTRPEDELLDDEDESVYARAPHGTMTVQVVRSVSDWSHGVLTEKSIQNAYAQLIQEAQHFIYIGELLFHDQGKTDDKLTLYIRKSILGIHTCSISNTQDSGPVKNTIAKALVERILRAARERTKFHVVVTIPEVPAFSGDIVEESSIKTIMAAQWRTINRGGHSICEEISKAGFDPAHYIRFYHLRGYDRINNPNPSFISAVERQSGISLFQAQVAQARLWLGESYGHQDEQKSVQIKLAQPYTEIKEEDKKEAKKEVEQVPLPGSEHEARNIVAAFEEAARRIRSDENVSDSVSQHMLTDTTSLAEEQWLGTPQEEQERQLMIVDDRRVIMGSANFNDRSQRGDGDSEIAIVVEDTDRIESSMDGQQYMASRFAATLRRKLYREHLGLIPPQNVHGRDQERTSFMHPAPIPNEDETGLEEDALVADPLSPDLLALWQSTAKKNRDIYTELFMPVPTDLVQNISVYKNYKPKVKYGHLIPQISLERAKQKLSQVRGQLVEMPLLFLIDEKEITDNPEWSVLNPTLPIYL